MNGLLKEGETVLGGSHGSLCFPGRMINPNHFIHDSGDLIHDDIIILALLKPTASPTPRFGHAMTFDIIRNRVVMFGGWDSTSRSLADTWEYDGKTWTKMAPTASPPGRDGHVLAYDLARGRTVLFGGDANGTIKSDTWEYDGKTWLQIKPTTLNEMIKRHQIRPRRKRSAGAARVASEEGDARRVSTGAGPRPVPERE